MTDIQGPAEVTLNFENLAIEYDPDEGETEADGLERALGAWFGMVRRFEATVYGPDFGGPYTVHVDTGYAT